MLGNKSYLLIAFSLLVAGCALPPKAPPEPPAPVVTPVEAPRPRPAPRIALALGGGAARGFSHVGVIKALEAQGIVPDMVVGTSAGSVVGALYAAGHTGFELQRLALAMDEVAVADWSLLDRGLFKGESLQNYVNKAVGYRPIEKLRKPFAAVATDLQTGEMVAFRTGNVGMAVRASSSVPGVFQPVSINGRDYVDGGAVSPVPVKAARSMGADLVIAVDISSKPKFGRTGGPLEILLQTYTIMGQAISNYELADADVVIRPANGAMGSADFQAKHLAILEGEQAAMALVPTIKAKIAQYMAAR